MPKRPSGTLSEQATTLGRQGLRKFLGPTQPLVSESEGHELAYLLRRREQLTRPNPYRTSFARFHSELCWTRDEARGRIQTIPDYLYLRQVEDALLTKNPLLIDKARRQLITWTVLAFDLWLIGGGQDPRWPELMPNPTNPDGRDRKVVLAARKLEDENGSADFLSRIQYLYQQFEGRGGREKWPEFPELAFRYSRATAANGGIIAAVPQGKDQLAGSGITFIHAEEFSRWTEQKASLASALQTLQGGGHLVLVCTAQAGTHAARIVLNEVRQ